MRPARGGDPTAPCMGCQEDREAVGWRSVASRAPENLRSGQPLISWRLPRALGLQTLADRNLEIDRRYCSEQIVGEPVELGDGPFQQPEAPARRGQPIVRAV